MLRGCHSTDLAFTLFTQQPCDIPKVYVYNVETLNHKIRKWSRIALGPSILSYIMAKHQSSRARASWGLTGLCYGSRLSQFEAERLKTVKNVLLKFLVMTPRDKIRNTYRFRAMSKFRIKNCKSRDKVQSCLLLLTS